MDEAVDEREALLNVAVLEALLQEMADEQGPNYAQRVLLGEAAPPPAELLRDLRDAKRDLAMIRQNQYLARLLGHVEAVEKQSGTLPADIEAKIRRLLTEHAATASVAISRDKEVLSVQEAASVLNVTVKTLQNRISDAKRSGRELPWVLRAGRKRGCAVHRERFLQWLEQQPRRRGRPAGR
jgi:DNA-binding transcriptional regulator YiaG